MILTPIHAPQKIVENVKINITMVSACMIVGREEELHARLIIDYVYITFAGVKICKAQSTLHLAAQMEYIQIAAGYVTAYTAYINI